MNPDTHVRTVVYLPRDIYRALADAADAASEPLPDALRARLASSLTVSQTAERSGCAGRGEASASPTLGA